MQLIRLVEEVKVSKIFSAGSSVKKAAPESLSLGVFIRKARQDVSMTLRDVEEATQRKVSNAYLCQIENAKIAQPSPRVLLALSRALNIDYEALMKRAGYLLPLPPGALPRAAGSETFSIDNLTADEERQLLEYLTFLRGRKK